MFYTYRQNNPGGFFINDESVTINVIVEAENSETADRIAESHGIYFNGVSEGYDCPCCGDRWYESYLSDGTAESPVIYGNPVGDYNESWVEPGEVYARVYMLDSTIKEYMK